MDFKSLAPGQISITLSDGIDYFIAIGTEKERCELKYTCGKIFVFYMEKENVGFANRVADKLLAKHENSCKDCQEFYNKYIEE